MRRRIFLVRHGVTDWNSQFRYQGISDIPLNEEGLTQARRVAIRFRGARIGRVFASPLTRASKTAEIVAASCADVPAVELCKELVEISFGKWEGLTVKEIKENDAEAFESWRARPFSCAPSEGEHFDSVMERAKKMADELTACGCDALVVAHGGILRALIAALLASPDPDIFWRMRIENCSISVMDIWRDHPPSLFALNDIMHLGLDEASAAQLPLTGTFRPIAPSLESA